jgi:hypothetical protein
MLPWCPNIQQPTACECGLKGEPTKICEGMAVPSVKCANENSEIRKPEKDKIKSMGIAFIRWVGAAKEIN